MKKIFLLLFLVSLGFYSCEDQEENLAKDCMGIAGGSAVCGCTDSLALNYDSLATDDDGSCEFDTMGTIVGRDIYIAGESYDSEGVWTSCYWKNGERFELPGGYLATDITVVDGVVYTS